MKGLKYLILPLALMACLNVDAKSKKKVKKSKKVEAVKVDTCSVDTFSYAMGIANTQGLQDYLASRMDVDPAYMADFIKGFDVAEDTEESKKIKAYCAGLQIRQQVQNQIITGVNKQIADNDSVKTLNEALFIEGFRNAIAGNPTRISAEKAQELSQKQMEYYNKVNTERKYGNYRKECEEFLKTNAKKDGIKVLPCGVQYKVLVKGTGEIPTAESKVKVHYSGSLIDGTEFDSSYKRNEPATFACNQVIKGWTEALSNMPVGSKWEIIIPQELGYGEREAGKIKPYSTLIFTVELLEIVK